MVSKVKIKLNKVERVREVKCPFCEHVTNISNVRIRGKIYDSCRHLDDYNDRFAWFSDIRKGVNEP